MLSHCYSKAASKKPKSRSTLSARVWGPLPWGNCCKTGKDCGLPFGKVCCHSFQQGMLAPCRILLTSGGKLSLSLWGCCFAGCLVNHLVTFLGFILQPLDLCGCICNELLGLLQRETASCFLLLPSFFSSLLLCPLHWWAPTWVAALLWIPSLLSFLLHPSLALFHQRKPQLLQVGAVSLHPIASSTGFPFLLSLPVPVPQCVASFWCTLCFWRYLQDLGNWRCQGSCLHWILPGCKWASNSWGLNFWFIWSSLSHFSPFVKVSFDPHEACTFKNFGAWFSTNHSKPFIDNWCFDQICPLSLAVIWSFKAKAACSGVSASFVAASAFSFRLSWPNLSSCALVSFALALGATLEEEAGAEPAPFVFFGFSFAFHQGCLPFTF